MNELFYILALIALMLQVTFLGIKTHQLLQQILDELKKGNKGKYK